MGKKRNKDRSRHRNGLHQEGGTVPSPQTIRKRLAKYLPRTSRTTDIWGNYPRRFFYAAAICTIILAVVVGGWTVTAIVNSRSKDIGRLQNSFSDLVDSGRYRDADQCIDRLIHLYPVVKSHRFQKALLQDYLHGDRATHSMMLELVASEESPEAAHWLLAHDYQPEQSKLWSDDQRLRFKELVELALQSDNSDKVMLAKKQLAAYSVSAGDISVGFDLLSDIGSSDPSSLIAAATLCMRMGKTERAQVLILPAQKHYLQLIAEQPSDDESRLQLARTMIITQTEEKALKILSDGFELTHQPLFQQAAGEVLVAWSKRLLRDTDRTLSFLPRVQLIHRATQCAPQDMAVVQALQELLSECQANRDQCLESLHSAASYGVERESVHFVLGLWMAIEGKHTESRLHIDLACLAGSHVPTVINNLALRMLVQSKLLANQALELAILADAILPDQPHFCETRGRILIQLDRFEEAVPYLITAMRADELKPIVYPNLALAYRKIGDEGKAQEMEGLAKESIALQQ